MASARQGFFCWELDITYYVLRMLSWFGLVWDLRQVPAHMLAQ
jgi:stearoyl-CoA desaturase (delta-9 desaturase)